jgi:hypothetical protein
MDPKDAPQDLKVEPRLAQLFDSIEKKFDATKLSRESWYILAVACLVASPDPELAAQLYVYLRDQAKYSTSTSRQGLVKRLREALVKSISIVGVCKPIEAIVAISKVERAEDKDYSCTRRDWKCDEANHQRATAWFEKLYAGNSQDTMALFNAHQDFAWISTEITYGFYLSDRQVLGDVDTEMVVLPAIMMQNLKNETHWHIRGTRRVGVSKEDTQVVWDCIQLVASYFSIQLTKVPSVAQVEPDV